MTDPGVLTERLAIYNRQLHQSFAFFLKECWRAQGMPIPARIQLDVADWLQRGPKRRGLLGFRGMAKTWMTSAYICWRLLKNIEEKVLLASAGEDNAKATLRQIRNWIGRMPFLQHLAPDKTCLDNTEAFEVAGCGQPGTKIDRVASVAAIGIDGALPGNRATIIVCDDVEQDKNTVTRNQRERIHERVTEFEAILTPGGDIIYLGTYHHLESLYDKLQKVAVDRNYRPFKFRNWPIEYPDPDITTPILSPMLRADLDSGAAQPGQPVWPERFGRDFMLSLNMGRTRFLEQFMGFHDAGDTLRYPLKLSDLIVHPVNHILAPTTIQWGMSTNKGPTALEDIPSPGFGGDQFHAPVMISDQWIPYSATRAFADPAGAGTDEFAWCIGGQLHGYIFAKYLDAFTGGATEANLDRLVLSLKANHCHELHVEDTFGGDALLRLLEVAIARHALRPDPNNTEFPNGWSCAVIPHHAQGRGQKEVWIINQLEPVMNHHRLVIPPEVAKDTELARQIVFITKERDSLEHDDRIEALAGMVSKFSNEMGQNPTEQEERRLEDARNAQLAEYYQRFGTPPPRRSWSGLQPANTT